MENLPVYENALSLLRKVSTPEGFLAAPLLEDNYCRIWTRDAVVCGLAALSSGDEQLIKTFERSLDTIWQNQHNTGFIPSNVDPVNNAASFGQSVGRVDTASWAIIGLCAFALSTGKAAIADRYREKAEKAFRLLEAWEFNGRDLIYVPQSGDWADEYFQHGYLLFDNLLRLWALELASRVYHEGYAGKALTVRKVLENNFFYRSDQQHWYSGSLLRQKEAAPRNFWWMGFNPALVYDQFDLQANALALLLDLGNAAQNALLFNYIRKLLEGEQKMLPSFSPVITKANWEMHELENNYAFRFRNQPYEFHNGGLWPVWNGWMVMALQMHGENELARQLLNNIEQTVSKDDVELNECYHGHTNQSCGVKACAWSAAGLILAEKGVALFRDIKKKRLNPINLIV